MSSEPHSSPPSSPKAVSRTGGYLRLPVLLVSLIGLAMTVIVASFALRWERESIYSQFSFRVADEVAALNREIDANLDAIRATAAFFASSEVVYRPEFESFAGTIIQRRTSMKALEWIPRVPASEAEIFVASVRAEGFDDFQFRVITPNSEPLDGDYYPVVYIEPLKGNEAAMGLELASEARRRNAMIRARDTGLPTASPALQLVQDIEPHGGVVVFVPVYTRDEPLTTIEIRRRALRGFVVGIFYPGEIVEEALQYLRPEQIVFTVHDVSDPEGTVLLHTHGEPDLDGQALIEAEHELEVAGRVWNISFSSTNAYEQALSTWTLYGVLLSGLLLTGLATVTLAGQLDRTSRIEQSVEDRTRDLKIANEKLRGETEERLIAAEALRESDIRMRSILDYTSSVIFIKDTEGRYLLINRRYEERFHVKNADYVGQTDYSVFPKHVADAFRKNDLQVIKSGETLEFEEKALQDGEERTYLSVKLPLRHENGTIYAVCGIATDITERKRAEVQLATSRAELETRVAERTTELRERERTMTTLLSNLPGAVYRCKNTPDWPMEFISEGIRGLSGYAPEDLTTMRVSFGTQVVFADDQDEVWKGVQEALSRKEPYQLTYRIRTSDGRIKWVWEQGQGVFDAAGELEALEGYITDISARMMAEEALRRLNEELEQRVEQRTQELKVANRELEAFSYSVSHDLRAPLRTIDGFSQALFEDFFDKLDPDGRDNLQRVRSACQRMGQLIDDLLALSRVTRADINRCQVSLSTMASATLGALQLTQPDRKAEFVIEPEMQLEADPRLLQIALDNLLGNAWKFTGRREVARIEVGRAPGANPPGGDIHSSGATVFFVRDNGAGFDMQYATKLFGVFQRFHSTAEFPGTGIGLATVQRIVHRHAGEIWCESAAEQGTTFYFYLG